MSEFTTGNAPGFETAREAAGGLDVRIGGGVSVIREFVAAGLIDHMHIAVVPILLGRGERLWDGLEGLEKDYEIEATSFVAPTAIPQLADADQLMASLPRRPGVRYPALVPNARGLARAEAAGVDAIAGLARTARSRSAPFMPGM